MIRIIFIPILIAFFSFNSKSQITKANWLMGGSGRFAAQKETLYSNEIRGLNLQLSPAAGYFFVDKFAGGLRGKVIYEKVEFNGGVSKTTQLGIGPFLRYYFLNTENRINVFAESAYQYLFSTGSHGAWHQNTNAISLSAGPVIYLNSNVGIECTINYESSNRTSNNATNMRFESFFVGIGFQIHFE